MIWWIWFAVSNSKKLMLNTRKLLYWQCLVFIPTFFAAETPISAVTFSGTSGVKHYNEHQDAGSVPAKSSINESLSAPLSYINLANVVYNEHLDGTAEKNPGSVPTKSYISEIQSTSLTQQIPANAKYNQFASSSKTILNNTNFSEHQDFIDSKQNCSCIKIMIFP